jgi:ATP-dependent helicase/nuclease subunit B
VALTCVIGRAGSGKTHFSYERIRAIIRGGEKRAAYLLVPEQMTYRADVELLNAPGIPGFSRTQVVSFKRLNQFVAAAVGRPLKRTLSKVERAVLIRRLLLERESDLRFFAKSADKAGFIDELAALFSELKQAGIPPGALETEEDGVGIAVAKMSEIARLYAAYQAFLFEHTLRDADDYAAELATALAENPHVFAGAEFYVDSFASFTPAETVVLKAVMRQADDVYVNVLADPAEAKKCMAGAAFDERSHFSPTLKAMLALKTLAEEAAVQVAKPMYLPADAKPPPRFTAKMAGLECSLFAERRAGSDGSGDALTTRTYSDRTAEAAGIAHEIQLLVRRQGYRFGEVAVLMRDLGPYRAALKAAFDDAGIPYFLDERDTLSMTPLSRAVEAAIDAVESGFTQESVIAYMKASATAAEHEAVCKLENYALAHGTMFGRWLRPIEAGVRSILTEDDTGDDAGIAELEQTRATMMGPLVKLRDETRGVGKYEAFGRAVVGLIDEIVRRWGNAEADEEIVDALLTAVAGITHTLGDVHGAFEEFAKVLHSAIDASSVGRVPMALDAVSVGEVERSRLPDVRAVFVIGMTERMFPRSFIENEILSDDEREAVNDALKISLPLKRKTLAVEKLLFYVAVTRAREKVFLTRPLADERGSPLSPSLFLAELGISNEASTGVHNGGEALTACASVSELRMEVIRRFADCAYGIEPEVGEEMIAAHNSLIRGGDSAFKHALQAFAPEQPARVRPDVVAPALGSEPTFSVTELEDYAQCPFKYFAGHLLDLRERAILEPTSIQEGILVHRILERFYGTIPKDARGGRSLAGPKMEQVWQFYEEALDGVRGEIGERFFEDDPRMVFLWDRLAERLRAFIEKERGLAETSRYVPWAFEASFRGAHKRLPTAPQELRPVERLAIADSLGRKVFVKGKIDRIDLNPDDGSAVVVDYKLTLRGPNRVARFAAGLDLQVPMYVIAVSEAWGKPCVAGFYVAVADRATTQKYQVGRRRGFFIRGRKFNSDNSPFPMLAFRADGLEEAEFADILARVKAATLDYADQIDAGEFDVSPVQDGDHLACNLCPFAEVCRIDPRSTAVRVVKFPQRKKEKEGASE